MSRVQLRVLGVLSVLLLTASVATAANDLAGEVLRARELVAAGETAAAVDLLEQVAGTLDSSAGDQAAEARLELGVAFLSAGEAGRALVAFLQSAEVAASPATAWIWASVAAEELGLDRESATYRRRALAGGAAPAPSETPSSEPSAPASPPASATAGFFRSVETPIEAPAESALAAAAEVPGTEVSGAEVPVAEVPVAEAPAAELAAVEPPPATVAAAAVGESAPRPAPELSGEPSQSSSRAPATEAAARPADGPASFFRSVERYDPEAPPAARATAPDPEAPVPGSEEVAAERNEAVSVFFERGVGGSEAEDPRTATPPPTPRLGPLGDAERREAVSGFFAGVAATGADEREPADAGDAGSGGV